MAKDKAMRREAAAAKIAQDRLRRTDPTERRPYSEEIADARQHLLARTNPGEHCDPYAE